MDVDDENLDPEVNDEDVDGEDEEGGRRTEKTIPTLGQLTFFAERRIEAPVTCLACTATIRYLLTGFPGCGDMEEAGRLARYREACTQWVGKRVRFTFRGEGFFGTVLSIRGLAVGEARYMRRGDRSLFMAIIQYEDSEGIFFCSLGTLTRE